MKQIHFLDVACSDCGARAGEPCRKAMYPHEARRAERDRQRKGSGAARMKARDFLAQMADAKDLMNRDGHRVLNFQRWLLDNGEPFDQLLDHELHGLSFYEPRQCFCNAAQAVLNHEVDTDEWFYTEGVITFADLPLEIHHAWLTNRDGQVLDITSRHAHEEGSGANYWGVPFTLESLRKQVLQNQIYGLFSDGIRYLPVTHEPVPDAIRAWPRDLRQEAA